MSETQNPVTHAVSKGKFLRVGTMRFIKVVVFPLLFSIPWFSSKIHATALSIGVGGEIKVNDGGHWQVDDVWSDTQGPYHGSIYLNSGEISAVRDWAQDSTGSFYGSADFGSLGASVVVSASSHCFQDCEKDIDHRGYTGAWEWGQGYASFNEHFTITSNSPFIHEGDPGYVMVPIRTLGAALGNSWAWIDVEDERYNFQLDRDIDVHFFKIPFKYGETENLMVAITVGADAGATGAGASMTASASYGHTVTVGKFQVVMADGVTPVTNYTLVTGSGHNYKFEEARIPLTFEVNLAAQIAQGNFNPSTGRVSLVSDLVNNWDAGASVLTRNATNTNLWSGTFEVTSYLGCPILYKYVLNGSSWETNSERTHTIASTNAQTVAPAFFNNLNQLGRLTVGDVANGQMTLSWTAGPMIRLQTTSDLSGRTWRDVPNTRGLSSTTVPVTPGPAYYQLVGP